MHVFSLLTILPSAMLCTLHMADALQRTLWPQLMLRVDDLCRFYAQSMSPASCRSKRVDDHNRFYANFTDPLPLPTPLAHGCSTIRHNAVTVVWYIFNQEVPL